MSDIEKLLQNLKRRTTFAKEYDEILYVKADDILTLLDVIDSTSRVPSVPVGLDPNTKKLVVDFCAALAEKLYNAEVKYGRQTDWMKDDWYAACRQSLWEHIAKGDPRDVAAYCAFMWYHGWKTEAAQQPVVPECFVRFHDIIKERHHGRMPEEVQNAFNECAAMLQAGNSPVIPDSSVIGWLCTDYQRDFQVNCTAPQFVMGKNDPSSAWGVQYMPVTKAGGQQNSPQNIPEIIPQWIPVSERLPEDRMSVILWDAEIGEVTSGHYSHKTQTFYHCGDAIRNEITHWMPPPAAPQEVINYEKSSTQPFAYYANNTYYNTYKAAIKDGNEKIIALYDRDIDIHNQEKLRELVDLVWNTATESTEVPSTKWADELITKVFGVYKNDN